MEASVLRSKKSLLKKGKLKKTIKNIICRPDSAITWPELNEIQAKFIVDVLETHKVEIPECKKLHWKELKLVPKEQRPKEPKIKKVNGLIFGVTQCCNSVINEECSAIIIESTVNPRMIVQPVIDNCIKRNIPVVCLQNLRKYSQTYFGIATSCLGIRNNSLEEISNIVKKVYPRNKNVSKTIVEATNVLNIETIENEDCIDKDHTEIVDGTTNTCPYLYRDDKKVRIFVPSSAPNCRNKMQDYIKITSQIVLHSKRADTNKYMNMMLKKVTNNPNRKRKHDQAKS